MAFKPGQSGNPATQFKPGQSGNPGGGRKGVRVRVNAAFLSALADDFQQHGAEAIRRCREENPGAYIRVLAGLLPKEVELRRPLEEFSDDELDAAIRALRSFLDSQHAEGDEQPQPH